MARPTTTFTDFVASVTKQVYVPKVVENILEGNFALMRFLGNSRPWPGGDQVILPVKMRESTALGSYSGLDTFSTAQSNEREMASVDPRQSYASIVISGMQQAVNAGEGRVLDLLAVEMESKANDLKDAMGDQFYSTGTGNSSKDITGLLAAVDDNTDVSKMASQSDYMLGRPSIRYYAMA